jgi:hypothetical protein
VALDRQLLAIDVVDDFGLGHVWLKLRPRDGALDVHCELGLVLGLRLYIDEEQACMGWKCMSMRGRSE